MINKKYIDQILINPRYIQEYLIIYSDNTSELFQNNYGVIETFNKTETKKMIKDLKDFYFNRTNEENSEDKYR